MSNSQWNKITTTDSYKSMTVHYHIKYFLESSIQLECRSKLILKLNARLIGQLKRLTDGSLFSWRRGGGGGGGGWGGGRLDFQQPFWESGERGLTKRLEIEPRRRGGWYEKFFSANYLFMHSQTIFFFKNIVFASNLFCPFRPYKLFFFQYFS